MSDHGSLADRVRRTTGGPELEVPPLGHAWIDDGRQRRPGLLLEYRGAPSSRWGLVLWAPDGPNSGEETFIATPRIHHGPLAPAPPVRTVPTHVWVAVGQQRHPGLLIEWARPKREWWGRVLWAPEGPDSGEENLVDASRLTKA